MLKLSLMSASMSVQGASPSEIADTAAAIGLDGIEWVTELNSTAKELRHSADAAGMPVVCYTFFAQQVGYGLRDGLDVVRRGIDYALELGAPMVMVPFAPLRGHSRLEAQQCWVSNFPPAAELILDSGLTFAIENYPGFDSPMIFADDFFVYKRHFPQVKLVFDDGNAGSVEDELESCVRTFDDIVHVHFKDWRFHDTPGEGKIRAGEKRWMSPELIGEGDVKTQAVWRYLQTRNYRGYVSLEYEGRFYGGAESMRRAAAFLRGL